MVDNVNPTSQFHPYQPQNATPAADRMKTGGLGSILGGLTGGLSGLGGSMKNFDLQKARNVARNNGGLVLGGLAALAIGAGLMRRRR